MEEDVIEAHIRKMILQTRMSRIHMINQRLLVRIIKSSAIILINASFPRKGNLRKIKKKQI